MKVLVVGGGGREHALVRKIKGSKKVDEIFCTPGNGGISYDAKCFDVAATDIDGVVNLAKEIKADLVVVAPDDPLQNERLHRSRPRGACCWINARNAAG